ncbi:hypothetical protein K488DRAFT_45869 [Vararia minispora EC-137]|uniref:Uncharacterized protein n=1 Tax=Vararia minispora EC-137 TaxID=1314806 RepID=A0ACB8QSC7_9AGAM|nr:hypothetical protein K488DRAFT_45869 [Vararia minispora EC-137]
MSQENLIQYVSSIPAPAPNYPITFLAMFSSTYRIARMARHLLGTDRPARALQVLQVAHRLGVAPMHVKELYHKIAAAMAGSQHWDLIIKLDHISREYMGRTTVPLLNFWARALVKERQYAKLALVLRRFKDEGLSPNKFTFQSLLSGHLRNHDLNAAIRILDHMQSSGIPVDATIQAQIAAAYRALGPDPILKHRTLQALHHASKSTATFICNALLQLAIDADDAEWTGIMLELFMLDHIDLYRIVNPDGGTFLPNDDEDTDITMSSTAIRAASTLRINRSAFHTSPDVATYTILLHFAAGARDMDSAISLVAHMHRQGVKPDKLCLAALVRVMFAASYPLAALRVLADICPHNEETREILISLANALTGTGDLPIPQVDAKPSVEIFNAFSVGIISVLGLSDFQQVLQLMLKCGVRPNGDTVKVLVDRIEKAYNADLDILLAITSRLLSHVDDTTLKHCETLLRAVFRRATPRRGHSAWINKFVRHEHLVQAISSDVAKHLVARPHSHEPTAGLTLNDRKLNPTMDRLIQSLDARGALSNRRMFFLRMRYEVACGKTYVAQDVFQAMLSRGLHPTMEHYCVLMDGYAADGDMSAALDVFNKALVAGVRPTVVMYTILIAGYAREGLTDRALHTYGEMVDRGIRPDVGALDALVSASVYDGQFGEARRVLYLLWPKEIAKPDGLEQMSLKNGMKALHALWPSTRAPRGTLSQQERTRLLIDLRKVVRAYYRARRGPVCSDTGNAQDVWDAEDSAAAEENLTAKENAVPESTSEIVAGEEFHEGGDTTASWESRHVLAKGGM